MPRIEPRGKYLLVRPVDKDSNQLSNGLVLPESEEKEQKAQGEVEAVGAEVKDIKKGDKIVYGAFAGETVRMRKGDEEIERELIHDDDVIAFIREK